MEQESLIKSDDSHYCKEILRRVIKHDDPFKESKAKQLRRYIGNNSSAEQKNLSNRKETPIFYFLNIM